MVAISYFKLRCYVNQRGVMNESIGVDDMTDVYAYLDGAQDKPAIIRSPTFYWDQALRISRPNDLLYSMTIRSPMISKDYDIYLPLPPVDQDSDYVVFADAEQELNNKKITPVSNNLEGIEKLPDHRKTGKFQGSILKGEGLLETLVHKQIPELKGDTTEGSYVRYETSVTQESQTGNNTPPLTYLTMGKFDPVVKIKARIPDFQVSTNRFFFGFSSASVIINGETPAGLNDTVLMIGFRKDDVDFKVFRIYGDGVTITSPYSTSAVIDTNVFVLEIGFKDGGTKAYYRINEGQQVELTTDVPKNNVWLNFFTNLQNTAVNNAKNLDVFYQLIETRK